MLQGTLGCPVWRIMLPIEGAAITFEGNADHG
jgi:hypothetical protein